MMKMLIQLDEERVKRDRKYSLTKMWEAIDVKFEKYGCEKERRADGAVLYSGNPEKDYYTCINLAYLTLKNQKWFAEYCTKWIWYDNDDDETLPYQNLNVLARERQDNPLFARA